MFPVRNVAPWFALLAVVLWFGLVWFGLSKALEAVGFAYWTRLLVLSIASLAVVGGCRDLLGSPEQPLPKDAAVQKDAGSA